MACLTHENEAEIIAWLAIIAATVAMTNTGQNKLSATFTSTLSKANPRSGNFGSERCRISYIYEKSLPGTES